MCLLGFDHIYVLKTNSGCLRIMHGFFFLVTMWHISTYHNFFRVYRHELTYTEAVSDLLFPKQVTGRVTEKHELFFLGCTWRE